MSGIGLLPILLVIGFIVCITYLGKARRESARHRAAWRKWTAVTGVVLLALPGLITVGDALLGRTAADVLAEEEIMIPAGQSVNALDAKVFLVRGFVSVEGAEGYPIDYVQAVIPMPGRRVFALRDGRELMLQMTSEFRDPGGERVKLSYELEGLGRNRYGTGPIDVDRPLEIEPGHGLFQKTKGIQCRSIRPFGSLLSSAVHPGQLRIWMTPLENENHVDTMPADQWCESHAESIRTVFEREDRGWTSGGSGSGLEVGILTQSGLGLLILGTLCMVFSSLHGIRTLCIVIVCTVAYAGAVDSLVVTIESGRLDGDSSGQVAAAAIETAGTVMHPVSAVESLVGLVRSDRSTELRTLAIRCLDRPRLLRALGTSEMDNDREYLARLAGNDDPVLARAVRTLIGRLNTPDARPGDSQGVYSEF